MRLNRNLVTVILSILCLTAVIVQGGDTPGQLGVNGSLAFPPEAILSESCVPLLSSTDQVGFVPIVTDGSLVSFSTTNGQLISSVVVGHNAGIASMVEIQGKRLIAVPTANSPDQGLGATVSIIDAADPAQLMPLSLILMPSSVHFNSATRAQLTADGRFVLVASYYPDPTVYSFDTSTGGLVSEVPLIGRVSRMALYESSPGGEGILAVASAASNTLSLLSLDPGGRLTLAGTFTPSNASFDEWNNPAFGTDGSLVYIAASTGSQLFAVDSATGALRDSTPVQASPQSVSVSLNPQGDMIAVARIKRAHQESASGVSMFVSLGGRLTATSEFAPPSGTKTERSNNVAFSDDGQTGFIGSASGTLFAFDTTTGAQESQQDLGGELMGLSVNMTQHSAAVVRRKAAGDEIVVIGFDAGDKKAAANETTSDSKAAPVIDSIDPGTVDQGQTHKVHLVVHGARFKAGSVILYNGLTANTNHVSKRRLETNLPPALFDQPGQVFIQVKAPGGALSNTVTLEVGSLTITSIDPASVDQGQTQKIHLKVHGGRFKAGSVILYNGAEAETTRVSATLLTARLPVSLFDQIGAVSIQVRERKGTLSNTVTLQVVSAQTPAIDSLSPSEVLGPHSPFELVVRGKNFRETSIIFLDNQPMNTVFISVGKLKTHVPAAISKKVQDVDVQVVDAAVPGVASNTVKLTIGGPQIIEVRPSRSAILAGEPGFKVQVRGKNFRHGASLQLNGETLVGPRVIKRGEKEFKAFVPARLFQNAGPLAFAVQNPDGATSPPTSLSALPPDIRTFNPGQIIAGLTDAKLVVVGDHFRRKLGVTIVGGDGTTVNVPSHLIRFSSGSRVVVSLTSEKLKKLISRPGTLNVQVVNPNRTNGVPSVAAQFEVVAPLIDTISVEDGKPETGESRVVIKGKYFRKGVIVQFVKNGGVAMQRDPNEFAPDKLILTVRSKKLSGLGTYTVQVLNPGNIVSNAVAPQ